MNLSKIATWLGKGSVYTRDVNAVARGRYAQRAGNRLIGRLISNVTRGRWL